MKQLLGFVCMLMMATTLSAECWFTWWPGTPKENTTADVKGVALGLPGSQVHSIKAGAEVSLIYSATPRVCNGCQASLIGVNKAETVEHAAQVGLVNIADKAMIQVGLVCINKHGFLPFFIFFNFDRDLFN